MKRIVLLLAFVSLPAFAQANTACVCINGCTLISQPFPVDAFVPTDCQLQNAAGVQISSGPPALLSTFPADNSAICAPSTPTPVLAGAKVCALATGNLPAGTYSFTASATNAFGQGPKGPPLTFDSVAVLPKLPPAITLRPAK